MTYFGDIRVALLSLADQIETGDLSADAILRCLDNIFEMIGLVYAAEEHASIHNSIFANLIAIEHQVRLDYTTEELSKHAGRPCLEVPLEALRTLVLCGMTTKAIANMLAVSESTVRRRMLEEGLRYSTVGDEELDTIVLELQRCYPNAGCRMMMGHLRSRGIQVQRSRLADSLRRVNPERVMMRRLSIQIARRCQYNVPAPNHLWHIDGNQKLIRATGVLQGISWLSSCTALIQIAAQKRKLKKWRVVVHGGIDGFSRLIVYLNASTNNKATTVFNGFSSAVSQYGVPSRVRSDKGGENVKVAHFMVQTMGQNRNSHITGRSVHNQRIERLWRDVYENVLDLFYTVFTQLEIQGLLNPGDEIDIYALHRCFLHHIQQHLHTFKEAWNHHGLRTTNNRSPLQLWLQHRREGQDISEVNEDKGVDWTGPHNHPPLTEVIVPEIQLPRTLNERELSALPNTNVPLGQSYFETIHALRMMF